MGQEPLGTEMPRLKLLTTLLILVPLTIVSEASPSIVIDRLDCSGFAVHQEGGNQDAEYWVGIRGDCETFGFLWSPFPLSAGGSYETDWPEEWTSCWINWDNCHRYGILQPQPESIRWYFDLALHGNTIDTVIIDMPIPCRYKTYLPLIMKGE